MAYKMKPWIKELVLISIITVLVVGLPLYLFWQAETYRPNLAQSQDMVLFRDYDFRIQFTTTRDCKDFFSVKVVPPLNLGEKRNFGIFVPGSKQWPANKPFSYYSIYTQEVFDQFPSDELPGTPDLTFYLESGYYILSWAGVQDSPPDHRKMSGLVPQCFVTPGIF